MSTNSSGVTVRLSKAKRDGDDMRRVSITLSAEMWATLEEMAVEGRRRPDMQLGVIVEDGLKLWKGRNKALMMAEGLLDEMAGQGKVGEMNVSDTYPPENSLSGPVTHSD